MVAPNTHSPPPMDLPVKNFMPSDSNESQDSDGDSIDHTKPFKADYENWGTLRRGNRMLASYTRIPHTGTPNKFGQAQPATLTSTGVRPTEDTPTILEPAEIRKIMEANAHDLIRKHGEVFYKTKALKGTLKPAYMWVALEKNPETGNLYLAESVLDKYCPLWRIILAYKGNLKAFDDGKPPVHSPETSKGNPASWFKREPEKREGHQDDLAAIVKGLSLDLKEIKGDLRDIKNLKLYSAEGSNTFSESATSSNDAYGKEVEVEKLTDTTGPITPPPDSRDVKDRSSRGRVPEPVGLNKNADSALPSTKKRNRSSVREEAGSPPPQNQGGHAHKRRDLGRTL